MRPYLLASPAAVLLVGLLACPMVLLARVSLCEPPRGRGFYAEGTWTLANYADITDAYGLRMLAYTVAFGVAVASLALLLAYPLALFVHSLRGGWRWLALSAVLLPKFASALVILFGIRQMLGRGLGTAVLAESLLILPYAVLVLFVQLGRIDPSLAPAARGLGATQWQIFARVTLPLSLPGTALAGQLSLLWGMGAFLGPMLLGGPDETTLAVEVHQQALEYGRWPRAAALAVLLSAAVGACLLLTSLLTRRMRGPS